jgi:hypothetical protein
MISRRVGIAEWEDVCGGSYRMVLLCELGEKEEERKVKKMGG